MLKQICQDKLKNKLLQQVKTVNITQFFYKNVICKYKYFQKLIYNKKSKNKKTIQIFVKYYEIKQIVISLYYLKVNKLIESNYKFVINALFKFIDNNKN